MFFLQAFLCELSEIRPIHGTWSDESLALFQHLVPIGSKEFIGKVGICVRACIHVFLYKQLSFCSPRDVAFPLLKIKKEI